MASKTDAEGKIVMYLVAEVLATGMFVAIASHLDNPYRSQFIAFLVGCGMELVVATATTGTGRIFDIATMALPIMSLLGCAFMALVAHGRRLYYESERLRKNAEYEEAEARRKRSSVNVAKLYAPEMLQDVEDAKARIKAMRRETADRTEPYIVDATVKANSIDRIMQVAVNAIEHVDQDRRRDLAMKALGAVIAIGETCEEARLLSQAVYTDELDTLVRHASYRFDDNLKPID